MFGSYVIDSSAFLGIIDRRGAICQVRAMARSDAEEVSAVLSAYLLIQTELGKVAHVAQALSDLDGVQLAQDLVGPYDVIARVQAPVWVSWAGWWSPASRSSTASPAP
jgi:hypothetical protein